MIIPVRDFSTGKVIGHLWEEFDKLVKSGKTKKQALDEMKIKDISIRTMLLSHVEMIDVVGKY